MAHGGCSRGLLLAAAAACISAPVECHAAAGCRFFAGEEGDYGCPEGSEPVLLEECSERPGRPIVVGEEPLTIVSEFQPVGCFVMGGTYFYNTRATGHASKASAPVCKTCEGSGGAGVNESLGYSTIRSDSHDESSVPSTTDDSASNTTDDLFDCRADFANWAEGWSQARKEYCCEHYGGPCAVPAAETEVLLYDCGRDLSTWESAWDDDKQDWCCRNKKLGCKEEEEQQQQQQQQQQGDEEEELYDCQEDVLTWHVSWPAHKQEWCCKNHHLGCSRQSADDGEQASSEPGPTETTPTAPQASETSVTSVTTSVTLNVIASKVSSPRPNSSSVRTGGRTEGEVPPGISPASASSTESTGAPTSTTSSGEATSTHSDTTAAPTTRASATSATATSATSATSATTRAATTSTPKPGPPECSTKDVAYLPMDMPRQLVRRTADEAACRQRCASVEGCAHYSFWRPQRHCHIQGASARPYATKLFRSGPPSCDTKGAGDVLDSFDVGSTPADALNAGGWQGAGALAAGGMAAVALVSSAGAALRLSRPWRQGLHPPSAAHGEIDSRTPLVGLELSAVVPHQGVDPALPDCELL